MSEQRLPFDDVTSFGSRLRAWIASGASLTSNGYALVASSLITSALGMLFWSVATRSFTQEEVGIGAALIAAMTPLTHAAQFNFKNVLYRYAGSHGAQPKRLIRGLYMVAAAAALVLGSGFALLVPWVDPELTDVFRSGWVATGFVFALVAWTLYSLQEAVLVALRLSTLMPLKSLVYSAAKLAALAAIGAVFASGLSIVAAWIVPALVIGAITSLMLARYNASHPSGNDGPAFTRREFVGFIGWDYVGSLAGSLSYGMAPMLVISAAGTIAGAHFYLAFSIAYVLYLVGSQMGAAMMAEHSGRRSRPQVLYADAMVQTLVPVSVAALVAFVFAPEVMHIFGPEFVEPGGTVLRLLVLGAIPGSAIVVFLAICRTKGWLRLVALVQLLNLTVVLGLGYVLSSTMGGVGMALALLVTETTIATGLAAWTLSRHNDLHDLAIELVSALLRVLHRLRGLAGRLPRRRQADDVVVLDGDSWEITTRQTSLSDVNTQMLRRVGAEAVLKTASSPAGAATLVLENEQLACLHRETRMAPFQHLLPKVLEFPAGASGSGLLLTRLPGRDGRSIKPYAPTFGLALEGAAQLAAEIHRATANPQSPGPDWLLHWIVEPIEALAAVMPRSRATLAAIQDELTGYFGGREVSLGLGHGDFCLDNIMFEVSAAGAPAITGVVDWNECRTDTPFGLDTMLLILTARARREERQFGQVVLSALNQASFTEAERAWLGEAGTDAQHLRSLVLLAWLGHVRSNLRKSGRYRAARLWTWCNIGLVVRGYRRADG